MSYYNELVKFITISDKQVIGKGTIGVKEFNNERIKIYDGLRIETKFGTGRASAIPWVAFLSKFDTVQNGIYPVYLYYKEIKLLILAYGISESNKPNRSWNIQNIISIKNYFDENGLGKPKSYGGSLVYKVYDLNKELVENQVDHDLNSLLSIYKTISPHTLNTTFEKVKNLMESSISNKQVKFDLNSFRTDIQESGLIFSPQLIQRFIASLCTKPFVICSGLSGSGKTKLAQAFVQWISGNESQYRLIPVGADWSNREPLLGYPNGLEDSKYVTSDCGALQLIIEASKAENKNKPYFIILDEMNLSHVERYFADFLSIMESEDSIKLYSGSERKDSQGMPVPNTIKWPSNVFVIGTVNIDETTYMFSPKVLDRANVIEFRITESEIKNFLDKPQKPELEKLKGQGASMAENFLEMSKSKKVVTNEIVTSEFVKFFNELKMVGAEFGYRSATEMMLLITKLKELDKNIDDNQCIDIAIMQKLLPKLHGSRSKLVKVLIRLASFCVTTTEFEKQFDELYKSNFEGLDIKYPISFEKIIGMYKNVLANGFTSYAEA